MVLYILDGPMASELMEVQLPIVPNTKCSKAYRSHSHVQVDESILCAGLDSGGKDACRVSRLSSIFLSA